MYVVYCTTAKSPRSVNIYQNAELATENPFIVQLVSVSTTQCTW